MCGVYRALVRVILFRLSLEGGVFKVFLKPKLQEQTFKESIKQCVHLL